MKANKFTIADFNKRYAEDDDCLEEIFQNRYGNLKVCPACHKKTNFSKVEGRKCWACQWCSHQLHPLAGTIFHKSDTPLKNWFFAIYLFSNSKNGVAAKELQRQLGVTYKTAWRIAKQIRMLFDDTKEPPTKLSGHIEADETFVGGYKEEAHGGKGKAIVFGAVERHGKVITKVIKDRTQKTLQPLIEEKIEKGSLLSTDDHVGYGYLRPKGYRHFTLNHKKGEYVKGIHHTNTIEGFWGQLKRSLNGTYHAVSPKYLQFYVDEFSWRYSQRSQERPLFYPMLELAAKPLR